MLTRTLRVIAAAALVAVVQMVTSSVCRAQGQGAPPPQGAAAASAVLMPVYGLDLRLQTGWVDPSGFPSHSAAHPFAGVAAPVQQVWDTVHGVGVNVLRVGIDIAAPDTTAVQLANLAVWAQGSGALLVPVLQAGPPGTAVGPGYAAGVAALVRTLVATLRSGDGQYLPAYSHILAYQLESAVNVPSHHGRTAGATMQLRLLQAAAALRRAEREALAETGLAATPIQIAASFDAELVRAGAGPGVDLAEPALTQATASLTSFLTELAAAPDIDVFNVEWFPGSLSAGGVERFAPLMRTLIGAIPGKQLSLTTGQSTTFAPESAQRELLAMAFANLADLRASLGPDAPFTGLYVHDAIAGAAVTPPSARLPGAVASWDWRARTGELARAWSGEDASPELVWWERAVAAGFGIMTLGATPDGSLGLTPRAGFAALTTVATSAGQAAQGAGVATQGAGVTEQGTGVATQGAGAAEPGAQLAVTPFEGQAAPTTPGLGQALKDTAKQGVVNLLARFLDALGNSFSFQSGGGSQAGSYPGYGTQPTYEPSPATGFTTPTPAEPWPAPPPSEPSATPTETVPAPGGVSVTPGPTGAGALGGALQPAQCGPKLQEIMLGGAGGAGVGPAPVTLSLVNPCLAKLPGYKVVLLAGGKVAATTQLAPLLPRQTRSLILNNVVLPAGHGVEMTAEVRRADGRAGVAVASLVKRVDTTLRPTGTVALGGIKPIGQTSATAAGAGGTGAAAVRSTLPVVALATRVSPAKSTGVSATTNAAKVRSIGAGGAWAGGAPTPTQAPTVRPLSAASHPLPVAAGRVQPEPTPSPTSPAIKSLSPFATAGKSASVGGGNQPSPTPAGGATLAKAGASTAATGLLVKKAGPQTGVSGHPNLSVSAADVNTGKLGKPGDPWTITVKVHNVGAAPAQGAQALLLLHADGKVVARKDVSVDVPAGGTVPLTWLTRVPTGGRLQVEVSVSVAGETATTDNRVVVNVSAVKMPMLFR